MLIDTRDIISLTKLRGSLREIIEASKDGKTVALSDRGTIVSYLVPAKICKKKFDSSARIAFGIWAERSDIKNSSKWISKMRIIQSKRNLSNDKLSA